MPTPSSAAARATPLAVLLFSTLSAASAAAQAPSLDELAYRLTAMTAVSGFERAAMDTLLTLLPGSARDRAGNVVLRLGSGEPRSLIACPIDEPGFVVGGIRPDGYLTLRRAGPSPGPLADQQYEGQRVTIFGRKGPVEGVVGVRSTHLTRGRNVGEAPFAFDDAYVDVGADSASQVAALGIEILAPVARTKAPQRYGQTLLASPVAGRRAACTALLEAAFTARPARGSVVVAFVVEQSFTRRGLLTLGKSRGPFSSVVLLEGRAGDPAKLPASPDSASLGGYEVWGLKVRYAGTPVETISLDDATALQQRIVAWIGGAR